MGLFLHLCPRLHVPRLLVTTYIQNNAVADCQITSNMTRDAARHCIAPLRFAVLLNIKKALIHVIHVKAGAYLIEPLFGSDPPRLSGGVVTCERQLSAL